MKVVKMHLAPCLQLAALLLMICWALAWKKQKWSHRHLNEGIAAVLIEESRASKSPIGWIFGISGGVCIIFGKHWTHEFCIISPL